MKDGCPALSILSPSLPKGCSDHWSVGKRINVNKEVERCQKIYRSGNFQEDI